MLKTTCSFLCVLTLVVGAVSKLEAQILWDNGPMVTHPGAGAGGADVSMASLLPNAAGSNITAALWRGDDFTVGGPGWIVDQIDVFGYDTNNPVPRWDDATVQIRAGSPDGAVVGSASATWQLAGINRTFNGAGNLGNEARQISRLTADFGGLNLTPGDYWMVYTITHSVAGTNSWFSYVMDINPANPDDPITRVGNSVSGADSGMTWATASVTTGGWNQAPEIPFIVYGQVVPEPASMLLLALSGIACLALRRR